MKKLSKRFLTLAVACVMAMAMAVPTFADQANADMVTLTNLKTQLSCFLSLVWSPVTTNLVWLNTRVTW